MKYLCLVYLDEKRLDELPDADCVAYDNSIRKSGHCLASEALQSVQTATTVRVRSGKVSVTDGPFAETKEQLAGFYLIEAADLDNDGKAELVAGKRYYAHPSTNADPGTTDPAVLSWFELQRGAGGATFVQHVIHSDSGAGCNFVARDLTGDGKVDIFTTNKRGTFLHVQQ